MKVLSIPILSHDASICILEDGSISHYEVEERFSRKKHDGFPKRIIENIADKAFDEIFIPHQYCDKFSDHKVEFIERKIKHLYTKYIHDYEMHHVFHAYSGFYNSGFDEAICLSIDGSGASQKDGNVEIESVYYFNRKQKEKLLHQRLRLDTIKETDGKICQIIEEDESKLSVGEKFSKYSVDIGYNHLDGAGKIMGLAQYKNFKEKLEYPYNKIDWKQRVDESYNLQQDTQNHVLQLIKRYTRETRINNVVISGGYGLNCVANYYYLKNLKDINLYIDPICFDAGISIGAAYYHYKSLTDDDFFKPLQNVYIGHKEESYDLTGLETTNVSYDNVVDLLLEQKIVALFQGRSEAGQRALGNRSLLFDPRNSKGKDIVNKIKKRENFRPFAGTILHEEAHKWFNMLSLKESPYMQYAMDAYANAIEQVPAIIHADNTCRIQTVTQEQNQHFYNLISCFYKKTNVPMLMNTSFNLGGEPLVETFEHAIDTLKKSKIDYLYLPEIETLVSIKTHLHY